MTRHRSATPRPRTDGLTFVVPAAPETDEDRELQELVESNQATRREIAAKRPDLTAKQITALTNDPQPLIRRAIAKHPNLQRSHIERLLSDEDVRVKVALARHPTLTAGQRNKLRSSSELNVRVATYANPNITEKDILFGLRAANSKLAKEACANPALTPHLINEGLERGHAQHLYNHPRISHEQLEKCFTGGGDWVAAKVANDPRIPRDLLVKALQDTRPEVRKQALLNTATTTMDYRTFLAIETDEKLRNLAKKLREADLRHS